MSHFRMARVVACALVVAGVMGFVWIAQTASAATRVHTGAAPSAADLVITKTVAPTTTLPNRLAIYTVGIRNTGDVTATSVVMTDAIPSSLLIGRAAVQCFNTSPCAIVYVGRTLSVTVGELPPVGTVFVTVEVTPSRPSAITNVAYVSAAGGGEANPATNVATATLLVIGNETFLPLAVRQTP